MHGFGVYYFANGHRYDGAWHHGQKQGLGAYTFNSGEQRSGQWHLGALLKPARKADSKEADDQAASRPLDADQIAVLSARSAGRAVDSQHREPVEHKLTKADLPADAGAADSNKPQTVRCRIEASQRLGEQTSEGTTPPTAGDSHRCTAAAQDECSSVDASGHAALRERKKGDCSVGSVGTSQGVVHSVQQAGIGAGGGREGAGCATTSHAGGPRAQLKAQLCASGLSSEQSSRLSRSSSTDSCGSSCDSSHSDAQSSATHTGISGPLSPDPIHRNGMIPPLEMSRLSGPALGGCSGALISPHSSGADPFMAMRSFSSVGPRSPGSYDGCNGGTAALGGSPGSGFGFGFAFGLPVEQVVDQGRVDEAVEVSCVP